MRKLLLGDISRIREAALEEARRKAEEIISLAKSEAEQIILKYRMEASRKARELIDRAERSGLEEARRIESEAIRRAKLSFSRVKTEIMESVFSRAWNVIRKALSENPELKYRILKELISRGVRELGEVGMVELLLEGEEEEKLMKIIRDIVGGEVKISASRGPLGAVLYSPDGRIYVEATLRNVFEDAKRKLRPLLLKEVVGVISELPQG
ncbi:MAG: hypothetical protein B6U69_03465 [Thermofilum sp. ex4484_15]|nr:MAG: hypothetical protein B6U69_03465 [Thermofilum sp. ex4484_15]